MKVLMINGSCNEKGCTYTALAEVARTLESEGIESEILQLGKGSYRDCIGCGACRKLGKCAFDNDIVNTIIEKAKVCDGFIFGSPVYYAHPSARLLAVLDRVFFAASSVFAFKPGAAVVSARRAGTATAFDVLNKYFTISAMPVISSTYWNNVHGFGPKDVMQDEEGLQTMRNLGRNMAWFLKSMQKARENGILFLENEVQAQTNFIR